MDPLREDLRRDEELERSPEGHASTGGAVVAGAVTGGVIGGASAGPVGAVVGAVGGAIVGAAAETAMHADNETPIEEDYMEERLVPDDRSRTVVVGRDVVEERRWEDEPVRLREDTTPRRFNPDDPSAPGERSERPLI
jgi:uncharacterized protein YcfJ